MWAGADSGFLPGEGAQRYMDLHILGKEWDGWFPTNVKTDLQHFKMFWSNQLDRYQSTLR